MPSALPRRRHCLSIFRQHLKTSLFHRRTPAYTQLTSQLTSQLKSWHPNAQLTSYRRAGTIFWLGEGVNITTATFRGVHKSVMHDNKKKFVSALTKVLLIGIGICDLPICNKRIGNTSSTVWRCLRSSWQPYSQPDFPGCRPTDVERSARRRDILRVVVHFSSATQTSPVYEILFSGHFLDYFIWPVYNGPSSSLY